jgi:anti-anti-sigma factor
MLLKIDTHERGDTLRLTLSGEFDVASVEHFRHAVATDGEPWRRVEIDLSDVAFMDSAGLQVLVSLNETALEDGREVALVRPSHPVMRLLEMTGLEARFAVRD